MGMWPFRRRRSNRRKSAGGADITQSEMHDAAPGTRRDPAKQHNGAELAAAGPERRRSRRDTKRKSSREAKKLQRRAYSFSPGRNDKIAVAQDSDRPPVPLLPLNVKGKGRVNSERQETVPTHQAPLRAYTQPTSNTYEWQRMPTLHKRSAQELARRKSSKKRKEEHDREAEIRAMVAFMPTRPSASEGSSGRPLKRESKKMRSGLNRNLENPSSDISLPLADSIHSSLSSGSERQKTYKLSALDVLAPRPTIRYAEPPRYAPGASIGSDGSGSQRRRVSDRTNLPEEVLQANKRIDDLADDLDAHELRELMERDQKRREKKNIADRIKMERRLARRQEKQRADEATAKRDGTPPPPNMERGVFGREIVGLGIGTSAVVTSSKRKASIGSESGRGKRPAESFRQESTTSAQNQFGEVHRTSSLITDADAMTPGSEHSEPVIETAKVGTVAKAQVSPPASPKDHTRGASSISQMMELSKPEIPVPVVKPEPARTSTESSTRGTSSWTSFFKLRGAKTKRTSTPSSFSNTSRDSMQVGHIPQVGYTPMRSMSNVPKRTMSKFREDLPELPLSPPDSRVQSPEAEVRPIPIVRQETRPQPPISPEEPRVRYDTPSSGYRAHDAMRLRNETPTSGFRSISADSPDPEAAGALSRSLASIDSEGSWLSGRKAGSKRSSAPPQVSSHYPLRDSASSLHKRYKEYSESNEELGIAEDEYFSRLTPGPEEEYKMRKQSTGEPMPSSDEEDGGSMSSPVPSEKTKWGAVGRHPTVIHREPRAHSREGLLRDFDEDSFSVKSENTTDPRRKSFPLSQGIIEEGEGAGVYRATSVDRRHARNISAGSARLLDLKPRPSGEAKRSSLVEQ